MYGANLGQLRSHMTSNAKFRLKFNRRTVETLKNQIDSVFMSNFLSLSPSNAWSQLNMTQLVSELTMKMPYDYGKA